MKELDLYYKDNSEDPYVTLKDAEVHGITITRTIVPHIFLSPLFNYTTIIEGLYSVFLNILILSYC